MPSKGAADEHSAGQVGPRIGIRQDVVGVGMNVGDALCARDLLSVEVVAGDEIPESSPVRGGVAGADFEGDAAREGHRHHWKGSEPEY